MKRLFLILFVLIASCGSDNDTTITLDEVWSLDLEPDETSGAGNTGGYENPTLLLGEKLLVLFDENQLGLVSNQGELLQVYPELTGFLDQNTNFIKKDDQVLFNLSNSPTANRNMQVYSFDVNSERLSLFKTISLADFNIDSLNDGQYQLQIGKNGLYGSNRLSLDPAKRGSIWLTKYTYELEVLWSLEVDSNRSFDAELWEFFETADEGVIYYSGNKLGKLDVSGAAVWTLELGPILREYLGQGVFAVSERFFESRGELVVAGDKFLMEGEQRPNESLDILFLMKIDNGGNVVAFNTKGNLGFPNDRITISRPLTASNGITYFTFNDLQSLSVASTFLVQDHGGQKLSSIETSTLGSTYIQEFDNGDLLISTIDGSLTRYAIR